MKIVDNRSVVSHELTWDDLVTGRVYQAMDNTIFMKTDEDRYMQLGDAGDCDSASCGMLYYSGDFNGGLSERFFELDVELIIKGEKV